MNVLIFGGTGLLGSAAARIFIDRGHKVRPSLFLLSRKELRFLRRWKLNLATSLNSQTKNLKKQ